MQRLPESLQDILKIPVAFRLHWKMDIANGIITSFATVLQCFEYIQIARNFEDDYEFYQLKLDIARLRLSRWGEAAGIGQVTNPSGEASSGSIESASASALRISEEKHGDAEHCFHKIHQLFKRAQRDSADLNSHSTPESAPCDPTDDLPPRGKRLRLKLLAFVEKRRGQIVNQANIFKWVFYKKERFDEFLNKLLDLIKELEELFPPETKKKLEELSKEEFDEIRTGNLTVLKDVVECDPYLEALVKEALMGQPQSTQKHISISAGINNGVQQGTHNGNMNGLTFGTGYRIIQKWGGNDMGGRDRG